MNEQSEANYKWFQGDLPNLLAKHRGQHALIHNQSITGYYQTSLEAIRAGLIQFSEGCFSVELVDDVVEDLGFYSHVSAALHA